ncbi:MAG TPA: cupredoxin domain-containing protein [Acidimicrobiales bacterium]|nr:cupredoxin domain-containing protein [Acidimicrobiales bacterium]
MPTVRGKRGRRGIGGLLGVVLLVALTGCGSSSKSGGTVLGSTPKNADVVVSRVDSVTRYDPDKLQITLNKDVSFTVLNKDSVVHNVTIPAFAIDMDVAPGQVINVKIPAVTQAPRDGFFTFYCKYHQSQGEAGRITVSK